MDSILNPEDACLSPLANSGVCHYRSWESSEGRVLVFCSCTSHFRGLDQVGKLG